jgi:hypothetical protein
MTGKRLGFTHLFFFFLVSLDFLLPAELQRGFLWYMDEAFAWRREWIVYALHRGLTHLARPVSIFAHFRLIFLSMVSSFLAFEFSF